MPVVQDEISLTKVANGDDGRGILGTPVATYAQSTSGTIPPTTWSATRPNVSAGQYLWTRVVTTYTDNTTSETQTPTLMGKPGDPGLGIKSKSISYAVGTSGNTPPTSGWKGQEEGIPTVPDNQYLWTRTTLVYTDDSKTDAYSVGKMGADGANAKLLYLTASAENMAFNADDTPKTTQTINISAKLQNVTGTATFVAIPYIGNTAQTAITLGGTGNTRTLTSAQWTNKDWTLIAITATLDNLSDTLSIVKVKDGKEGETYYPHPAWMMTDGTFTKVYPNENLLNGSSSWTELDMPSSSYFTQFGTEVEMVPGKTYTFSIEVKKLVEDSVPINLHIGLGENKNYTWDFPAWRQNNIPMNSRVVLTYTIKSTDIVNLRKYFAWRLRNEQRATKIAYRIVKLEESDTATIFTTPPSVDYENAYPKYEGFYSDTNQIGSDNPDDYKPWTPFMGPQGKDGYTPVKNVDYFDGQPGQNGKSAYLWIRYSQNADGSGMTTDPANAKYTGYATTETNVAPTSPSAYRWQQTKGDPGIGIPGEPGPDGKTSYLHIKYSNDGGLTFTGNAGEDGGDYIGQYVDFTEADSTKPSDYTWSLAKGPKGDKGDSAPLISLSGATQAITIDKDGKITPASSFTVIGTAVNTSISNWTYSLNGGNFGSAVPTGVTRSGNTVTINPATSTFNQLTIRAADATVRDEFTISRIKDGGDGTPGADAYTVFLTNESYTFAGSTEAALADSTTTEVVVYKGITKITPTSITVGTKPTGLTSSVSGSVVTFVAATTLVTKSGTIPLTITADGKTFTKQFAYAISFQGGKGEPGQNGVSVTGTQVQYVQTSGTTEPTTGWSNTRPTPVPGQWLWTRSRSILSNGTYGSWVTVPTLIGREAIVINATAPSNPSTGTLWQMPSDPNVKQWDGTKWVDWGISIDNLIAENAVFKDGKFETLEGVQIIGSQFISPFDKEKIAGGTNWIRGTLTNADGMSVLEWTEYNKSSGVTVSTGTNRFYPDGISTMKKTGSIIRSSYYGADGIQISDGNLPQLPASLLTIEDIVQIPKTLIPASSGYSQYATSGDNAPFASRSGRIVQLSGAFKNNTELASGVSGTMGILPDWARPERAVLMRVQASYNNTYLLTVNTDGTITMSRHAAGASNVAVPSGSWLNIAIVYAAKNL